MMSSLIPAPAAADGGRVIHRHTKIERKVPGFNAPRVDPALQSALRAHGGVSQLSRQNVESFINDVQKIVREGAASLDTAQLTDFFGKHIADSAQFQSTIKYEMPGFPAQESAMNIGKVEYINGVLNGTGLVGGYEHNVEIQDVQIGNGGRTALVKTLITERGEMPWPSPHGTSGQPAEMVAMPVRGQSLCNQTLGIGNGNVIQMQSAECYTALSFDPFVEQELGDDMFFGR